MIKKEKIFLKDLNNLNIYLKLDNITQKNLFSNFNSKKLDLSPTLFSCYKLKHYSFPLDLFLKMLKKLKIKEELFYNKIIEIKYGQRSKQILQPRFPISKDAIYWNILFAFFCDGTSDRWSGKERKKIICPSYTSYSKEIMDNFIQLVQSKFGNFNYKLNYGALNIPLIIDYIFRSQHAINSFNTKSDKIPKFALSKKFRKELKNLNKINKTSILVRFLVDEGDKSRISLNPRTIELGISNTSINLVKIVNLILQDLKIKYHIVKRKRRYKNPNWKDAYQIQIIKGNKRDNLKKLVDILKVLYSKYKLITLTKIQNSSLKKAINYKYKKPIYTNSHSKEIQYLIKEFLLTKNITNIREINRMLIARRYALNRNSISNLLKRMPIKISKIKKRNIIYVDKVKLKDYIPYTKEQISKKAIYEEAKKMYNCDKKITFISKKLNTPWSTIKTWVSGKSKPTVCHGKWTKEIN